MTTKPDRIKFKIPIFCAKDRVTVCTGIKNENSDYLIVLKIDIWKTENCQLYWFSEHGFARTFQLHLSGLKSFFFGDICAWIHVSVSHFVRVLFHLYVIHARFCVIGNSDAHDLKNPFLAHLSTTCSGWAIAIDQCPASLRLCVRPSSFREQLLKKSSPLKPANRFQWNFTEMILGWCTFRKLQRYEFCEELWLPWQPKEKTLKIFLPQTIRARAFIFGM